MTTLTSQSRRCHDYVTSLSPGAGHHYTNLSVVMMQPPPRQLLSGDIVRLDHPGWMDTNSQDGAAAEEWLLPLLAKEFIEDHDLEWRELDYNADVGPPPTSFWVFMCQYDCKVFHSGMSERYLFIKFTDFFTMIQEKMPINFNLFQLSDKFSSHFDLGVVYTELIRVDPPPWYIIHG